MIIGITGADGLIGWHVRAYLRVYRPDIMVRLATRSTFADVGALARFVHRADAIIHCAGVNRGDDNAVERGNIDLARALVETCADARSCGGRYPHVVFTNSTHIARDTAYGRGKCGAAAILADSAAVNGASLSDMILPHVFGEFGRPFHNSVVSTFCHQLAVGERPDIQVDGDLELVHAQVVADRAVALAVARVPGESRVPGARMKVSGLLDRLSALAASYVDRQTVPNLADGIDLQLFNTFRSYRFPSYAETAVTLRTDARGSLFEAIRARGEGQTFLSSTRQGVTRGDHFHTQKFERFLVCGGEAEIRVRRLFDHRVHVFRVSGRAPCWVDMPTFHTHNIINSGPDELITLFWASELFDPARPDTIPEAVEQ